MKKLFSLIGVTLFAVLPFSVRAIKVDTPLSCTEIDENGNKTCTVTGDLEGEETTTLTMTLTEKGGATIDKSSITKIGNWDDMTITGSDGEYTVKLTSDIGLSGEESFFKFTYKVSGETDCKVVLTVNGSSVETTPANPDTPTENKKTGSTIPFVALGTMVALAGGAYVLTKNKSKMYNI